MEQDLVGLRMIDTRPPRAGAHWSISEIQTLIEGSEKSLQDLANELGRSVKAIKDKKNCRLGLGKRNSGSRGGRVHYWTPEEIKTLTREWRKGTSLEEIAKKIGRTESSIRGKRNTLKLGQRSLRTVNIREMRESYDAGIPSRQIAKRFGVSQQYVTNQCSQRPTRLSNDEIEIIKERYSDGCTCSCITRRLRRRSTAVYDYIQKSDFNEEPQTLDDLVDELTRHGLSPGQVAMKLELPRSSIMCALKRIRRARNV